MSRAALPFLQRLQRATNDHDLEALVDCFAADYRNETPAHPGRSFSGAVQVRSNWSRIFTFVPDITAAIVSQAVDGSDVWSEWEMSGTRLDGTLHRMRGVIIFRLEGERAVSARFYLEPVDESESTVDEAVQAHVHAGETP
ncbi:nuclear transport factor 2 family protein [Leifsonia sp. NPDC058292]|uniref:nuclear transport factor 2 family protein n=1 Tax=Leifsonia sp. NPDC058292 TaxID=3346428 RepID=UPI0036D8A503